ncbi:hypothetical protein [Gloeomargarita lithophora]|uniref:hypothetical protein n=1 Tax=Gloeomargarita lithophora TaxID=1188228 RepID=UPI0008F86691|nr:hypothetical protein [Gloeomargarita lithophora]
MAATVNSAELLGTVPQNETPPPPPGDPLIDIERAQVLTKLIGDTFAQGSVPPRFARIFRQVQDFLDELGETQP